MTASNPENEPEEERRQEDERRRSELERHSLGLRRADPENERRRRNERARELRAKNRIRRSGFR